MSQAKNGNFSSHSLKSHKGQYDTENSESIDDIYNKDIPTDQRTSLLFKCLKNHTIKQDIDIEMLVGSGININHPDNEGKTILMYAAQKGDIQLVASALDNNADIAYFDKHDKSALFYAIDTNMENADVVSRLLEYESNINQESQDRMTPLLKAVERGQYDTAKLLLEKGATINASLESTGDTPLHIAVRNKDKALIELLLEKHCDAFKKNKKKQTALDLCEPGSDLFDLLQRLASKSKETVYEKVTSSINVPSVSQIKSNNQNEDKSSNEFTEVIVSQLDQPQKVQKTEKGEKFENKKNKQKGGNQTLQESIINQENRSDLKESEDSVYQLNDFPDSSDDQNSLNPNREVQRKRNTSGASGASFSSITSGNSDKQLREYVGPLDTNPPTETTATTTISPNNTSKFSQNTNKQNTQNQNLNPQQVQQPGPNQQNSNQKGKKQKNVNNNQPNNGTNPNQGNFGGQKQQNNQQQQQQQQLQQQQQQFQQHPQNYQQFSNVMNPQQQLSQQQQQQMHYNQNMNFNGRSPQQESNGGQKYQKNQNRQFDPQRNQLNQSGQKINDQKPGLDTNFTPSKDKSQTILSPQMQNGMQYGNQQMNNINSMYFPINQMGFSNPNQNIYSSNKNQNGLPSNGEMNPRGMKLNINLNHPNTHKQLEDQANIETLKAKCDELTSKNALLTREKNDLKLHFESLNQNEKKLSETIKEKEIQLKSLNGKYENLEKILKNREADGGVIIKEEKSIMTEYIPEDFNPIEKLLEDPKPLQDALFLEDMHNQLHEEILKFESSVNKYNLENKDNYDNLIKKIAESVNEIVPDSSCEIYGSFATGLSLPWSDIDIVVKLPNPNYTSGILDNLESNLKKKKWVTETKYIRNTTVPVLKITCIPKENSTATKKIDISIQDPRHNGLPCVELVKEYLQTYPSLRALVLVLKHLLFTLNLNDTYSGGLSSYGLILMIVWYFQTRQAVNCMTAIENCNLATFLTGFLYCYGFEYDYYNLYQVFPKKLVKGKERDMMGDYYYNQFQNPPSYSDPKIYIQDPLSPNNNVGRSTFHIKEIKLSFMAAFFEAFKPCNCAVHNYASENLGDKKTRCSSIFRRMLNAYHPNK